MDVFGTKIKIRDIADAGMDACKALDWSGMVETANEIINLQADLIKHYEKMLMKGEELPPISTLNPDNKSRSCTCGARHTSNPSHHMSYCSMR